MACPSHLVRRLCAGALALALPSVLSAAADAQTKVVLRVPPRIAPGARAAIEVSLEAPGQTARRIRGATLSSSCGGFAGDSIYIAPPTPGRCGLTALVRLPDGSRAGGQISVEISAAPIAAEVYEAPPPTSPRRERPVSKAVGAKAKPDPRPPTPITAPGAPPSTPMSIRAAGSPEPLPQFPWPVPPATTHMTIPRAIVTDSTAGDSTGDRLGFVADKIEAALGSAQLDYAVYAVGDSGFAYVTKVEMIHQDASPYPPPDRFPADVRLADPGGGFLSFITSRFFARPGFFRVIAIVVTGRALLTAGGRLSVDSATALANGGMATLPPAMRGLVVPNLQFVAYVYEYERATASDSAVTFRTGALVPAQTHLVRAGLWPVELHQPAP